MHDVRAGLLFAVFSVGDAAVALGKSARSANERLT
jgi:hypothetical protein